MIGVVIALSASTAIPSSGVIKLTPESVNEIRQRCSFRKTDGVLKYVEPAELIFRPKPAAKFAKISCVLKSLQETDFKGKIGFISEPPPGTKLQ